MKLDLSVGACIVHEGKVLLMHHTKLDKWLFPGGHVEKNETLDQAVVREVKEETGLDFSFLNYSSFSQSPEESQKLALPFHANVHSVGDHDHYGAYYLGTVSNPSFISNNESKNMGWFDAEDIKNFEGNLPSSIKQMALYALSVSDMKLDKGKSFDHSF